MASYIGWLSCINEVLLILYIASLYCALIYLVFSWLYKEKVEGLLQLEKIITSKDYLLSLKFINTKLDKL